MGYRVELTDRQTKVLVAALEEYYRVRMGQFHDLANDIATIGVDLSSKNPAQKKEFNDFITRRTHAKLVFDAAYKIATDDGVSKGFHVAGWTEESRVAYDMWRTIISRVFSDNDEDGTYHETVFAQMSEEPLVSMEKTKK